MPSAVRRGRVGVAGFPQKTFESRESSDKEQVRGCEAFFLENIPQENNASTPNDYDLLPEPRRVSPRPILGRTGSSHKRLAFRELQMPIGLSLRPLNFKAFAMLFSFTNRCERFSEPRPMAHLRASRQVGHRVQSGPADPSHRLESSPRSNSWFWPRLIGLRDAFDHLPITS